MLYHVVLVSAIQQFDSAISKSEREKKTSHHLLTHIYGIRKRNDTDEPICRQEWRLRHRVRTLGTVVEGEGGKN